MKTRFALMIALAGFGSFVVACSAAEAAPSDQNVPAQTSAAVAAPPSDATHMQRFMARFDRNGDGKVEVAELPERAKAWLTPADTNKDGVLSADEMKAFHAQHAGERGAHHMRLDANGDHKIELSELSPEMKERLAPADTDKDGVLSREELKAFHQARAQERFQRADKNGDGALTADEVGSERWARLVVADQNGDGKLTQEELKQAFVSGKLGFAGRRHGEQH